MKCSDLLERLVMDGWNVVRQEGPCRYMQHPSKIGRDFIISFDDDEYIGPGCLNKILTRAGLS